MSEQVAASELTAAAGYLPNLDGDGGVKGALTEADWASNPKRRSVNVVAKMVDIFLTPYKNVIIHSCLLSLALKPVNSRMVFIKQMIKRSW